MKRKITMTMVLFLSTALCFTACEKEEQGGDDVGPPVGTPGNPRFNLQFTNSSRVDLDLYVQTPNGTIIYFGNPYGQGGELDVDCMCGNCPNGPNENIYWVPGTAPSGTYRFWVEYFDDCDGAGTSSEFTLRVINNTSVVETYTGTLSPGNSKSQVYSRTY